MLTFQHILIPDGEYDWILKGISKEIPERVTVTNNVIFWYGIPYGIMADGYATFHGDMFFPVTR